MDFFVISKWNRSLKFYENVMFSTDQRSAEFIYNLLPDNYLLTIEHEKPNNTPEFSVNDHMLEMLAEDEKLRQCNKCCMNCGNCYEEYGYTMCKLDEMPEDADLNNYVCDKWK